MWYEFFSSFLSLLSHWTVRKILLWCCFALAFACWEEEHWEQQLIICPGYSVTKRMLQWSSILCIYIFVMFKLCLCSLFSISAIWSLSFMDFMHYLREISASLQCETSGSSLTWNCSGKLWCLESECLLNYTRWDSTSVILSTPHDIQPHSQDEPNL